MSRDTSGRHRRAEDGWNAAGTQLTEVAAYVPDPVSLAGGLPVPVFGNVLHRREYLAVADLCEVLSLAAVRALPVGVYNCTSKTSLQTLEVVRIVAKALGIEPAITHINDRLVHDRCYAMDPVKLQAYGWKAVVDPVDAIAAAAVEMKFAGNSGEVLTSSWS